MKSDTPKHFHRLLGRRMVDWVVEAARAARRRTARRGHFPAGRAASLDGIQTAVQARAARNRRRAGARPGRRSTAWPATCSSSAATHPLVSPTLLRDLLEAHRREGAAATILSFRPADPREYGRVDPRRRRLGPGDRRGRRRVAGASSPSTRSTPRSTSSRPSRVVARARAARRRERAGRAVPHGRGPRSWLRMASMSAAYVAPDPVEARGREHARRARCRGRRAARPHQRGAHARRRHDRRPATTWIEPDVEIEPDADDPSVHRHARARRRSRRAPTSARTRSSWTRRSAPVRRSAHSVTFAPEPTSKPERRRAHSWRSRTRASAQARRCLTCPTSATPTSARRRTSARARSRPTTRPSSARASSARRSAATSRTGVDNVFVAPVTIGDNAWVAAGLGRHEERPARGARDRPKPPGQQGGI